LRVTAGAMIVAMGAATLAGCGSRKDEDIDANAREATDQELGSRASIVLPGASSDSTQGNDPCALPLTQSFKFTKSEAGEDLVEATFKGKTDKICEDGGNKKAVLYIKLGTAQFQPPVELDCQPRARDGWSMRCLNAAPLVKADGEVEVVVKADANYRSSQTSMQLTYETP
jgi:hypothetical protein